MIQLPPSLQYDGEDGGPVCEQVELEAANRKEARDAAWEAYHGGAPAAEGRSTTGEQEKSSRTAQAEQQEKMREFVVVDHVAAAVEESLRRRRAQV